MSAKRILDLEDVDTIHPEPTELKTEFIELGDVSVIPRDLAVQPYSPARQSSLLMSPSSAQSCSTRKLGELVDVKTELADASVIFREPYSPARQLSLVMSPCSAQSCSQLPRVLQIIRHRKPRKVGPESVKEFKKSINFALDLEKCKRMINKELRK